MEERGRVNGEEWNFSCHVSKQKISQSLAAAATACGELVSLRELSKEGILAN